VLEAREAPPDGPGPGSDARAAPGRPDARAGPRAALLCRACGTLVTWRDRAIVVREAHAHHVFNPAGVLFHIGCFDDAPGAVPVGPASDLFSWFPGFAWTVTVCAGCRGHLGWLFSGGPSPARFHGLILDRLTDGPDPSGPAPGRGPGA
jgi:hypothetical protein